MSSFVAFIVGVLFALGLGLSGMTQVQVVKGFLDIAGEWNPALLGVMVGAISVHGIVYFLIRKKASPLLGERFYIPTQKDIDTKLLLGSAIFGLGWGWAGICPGPGLVSLTSLDTRFAVFVLSLFAGMGLYKLFEKKLGIK